MSHRFGWTANLWHIIKPSGKKGGKSSIQPKLPFSYTTKSTSGGGVGWSPRGIKAGGKKCASLQPITLIQGYAQNWGISLCVCLSSLLNPNRTHRNEDRCDKSILLWLCLCQNAAEGMRSLFVPSFNHVEWLLLASLPQFRFPPFLLWPLGKLGTFSVKDEGIEFYDYVICFGIFTGGHFRTY